MMQLNLREFYATPADYNPPPVEEMPTNTMYPNMNSMEYRFMPVDKSQVELYRFTETLAVNAFGQVAVASNNYNGRLWCSSIFAYESFDTFGQASKEIYKLRVESSITDLKFYYDDMVSMDNVHLYKLVYVHTFSQGEGDNTS